MGISQDVFDVYRNKTRYGSNHVDTFSYDIQLINMRLIYDDVLQSNDTELIAYVDNAIWRIYQAKLSTTVALGFGVLVVFGLFVIVISRLWELRVQNFQAGREGAGIERKNKSDKNVAKFVLNLVLYNFVSLCLGGVHIAVELHDDIDHDSCHLLWKVSSALYVVSNWLLYWIMLKRANVALSSSMFDKASSIHKLTRALVVIMLISIGYVGMPMVTTHGVYAPDGYCLFFAHPIVAALFLAIDTIFSLCLLALFAFPLFHLMSSSPPRENETNLTTSISVLRAVVMRNVKLSTLAMSSTLIAMSFSAVVDSAAGGLATLDNLDRQYLRPVNATVVLIDILINTYVAHSLTSSWKPEWLMRRCSRHVAADHDAEQLDVGGGTATQSMLPVAGHRSGLGVQTAKASI